MGQFDISADKPCSGTVAIAVRPEKLKIGKTEPKSAKVFKIEGTVRDVAYFGDTSHVVVSAADGLDLAINVQNESREGGAGPRHQPT